MDSKASFLLFLALFWAFYSTSTAFNITRILSNYPEYSNFENLLVQTGIAKEINSRQTITVLAVQNGALGAVSGKPLNVVKRILSAHVILDYYDQLKLSKLQKASNILTTLYQTTGTADDQQGFLNVTRTPSGIKFGSASKGASLTASLVKSVTSQPYNISVLEVSGVIVAPGIEYSAPPPPPGATGAPKNAPVPAPSIKTPGAKAPALDAVEVPISDSPTESPTEAPLAADAPVSDASLSSPPDAPAADDDNEAPAAAPKSSSSSRVCAGGVAMIVWLVACVMGF